MAVLHSPKCVQGTNDHSIVSKLSMANLGYVEDKTVRQALEEVCVGKTRRAPLINR